MQPLGVTQDGVGHIIVWRADPASRLTPQIAVVVDSNRASRERRVAVLNERVAAGPDQAIPKVASIAHWPARRRAVVCEKFSRTSERVTSTVR